MLRVRRGDTVVEVIFAITIFCLIAIISITLMNNGINTAQGSLELTMARNEIDAQAEALRFIQNSFLAEREVDPDKQQYAKLWHRLTRSSNTCDHLNSCGLAIDPSQLSPFDVGTCAEAYADGAGNSLMESNHAFVINTRLLQPHTDAFDFDGFFTTNEPQNNYERLMEDIIVSARDPNKTFAEAPLSPRLIFTHHGYTSENNSGDQLVEADEYGNDHLYRVVARAEGIWVIAVRGIQNSSSAEPEFFDFYIRTCWYEPGRDTPTAIGTIVRLYNPEVVE